MANVKSKVCLYCEADFIPKSLKGKYCSISCKSKYVWMTKRGARSESFRDWRDTARGRAVTILLATLERSAKKGYDNDLDLEWLLDRINNGFCEATGLPFVVGNKGSYRTGLWTPSIDRTDSTKGYTKDNCRVVVWIYNNELSEEEVMKMAINLVNKNAGKK